MPAICRLLPGRTGQWEGLAGDWQEEEGGRAPPLPLPPAPLAVSHLCCSSGGAAPPPGPQPHQAAPVAPAHSVVLALGHLDSPPLSVLSAFPEMANVWDSLPSTVFCGLPQTLLQIPQIEFPLSICTV